MAIEVRDLFFFCFCLISFIPERIKRKSFFMLILRCFELRGVAGLLILLGMLGDVQISPWENGHGEWKSSSHCLNRKWEDG